MSMQAISRSCAILLPVALLACSAEEAPPAAEPAAEVAASPLVQPPPDITPLPASRDTSIRLSAQNTNFGRQTTLDVNRTLVAFDQAALRAAVGPTDYLVSASLELTLTDNKLRPRQPAKTVAAHRLTRSWTEAGATWNCAVDSSPANNRADCSGATAWSMGPLPPNPFVVPATGQATIQPQQTGAVRFDVTADVRGFLAGSLPNHGWMLRSGLLGMFAEFVEFASRESSTPPRLLLTIRRCNATICDDGNACTADTCDAQAMCVNAAVANGTACSDGNMCTGGDMCQAGVCLAGTIDTCAPPPVAINEVESNGGTPGDWVELHNRGTAPVDLSGFIFKDNDDTHSYTIPAGTSIAPGAFLVLEEAQFNFGLGAAESARLFMPNGTTITDTHSWTAHAPTSYGRCPDGTGSFATTTTVTKGAANDCSVPVVINEIESNGGTPGDWVELHNKGLVPADLSGFQFRDNDNTHNYVIPAGTTLAPGAYLVLEEAQFGFGLGGADSAILLAPGTAPATIDSHSWTAHAPITLGRCPNGTGAFADSSVATKGAANDCGGPPPPPPVNVVINEVESNGGTPGDWVELLNRGSAAADLSGYIFRDSADTAGYTLPAGTMLAPGAFLVLEEAQFTFGLGAGDSARLFDAAGVQVDSYTWTAHALTTYGRCGNGLGATPFVSALGSTKGAANQCPTFTAWPGDNAVTTIDPAGSFPSNLSGLTFEPATPLGPGALWAVTNSPSTLFRLVPDGTGQYVRDTADGWGAGKTMVYPTGTGVPDTEGVTRGIPTCSAIYVATERDNGAGTVSRMAILRYDTSTPGTTLTPLQEWNLTADLPPVGANLGLEAITWVSDSDLMATGFIDERTNTPYNPPLFDHGGGVFFVGVEGTGLIHAYVLDHTSSTFARIASIASGQTGVMGLEFDSANRVLWAWCDDTCGNRAVVLGTTAASSGRFVVRAAHERPTGLAGTLNNEGIAFAPCAAGVRSVFWCDDSNTGNHALRAGSLTCDSPP